MMDPYPTRKLEVRRKYGCHVQRDTTRLLWHIDLRRRHFLVLSGPVAKEPRFQDIEAHVKDEAADETEPKRPLVVLSQSFEVEFH